MSKTKEVREDIKIFQDKESNKTTIVITNLTAETKKKIALLLLNDLEAVDDTVGDLVVDTNDIAKSKIPGPSGTRVNNVNDIYNVELTPDLMERIENDPPLSAEMTEMIQKSPLFYVKDVLDDTAGKYTGNMKKKILKECGKKVYELDEQNMQSFIYQCSCWNKKIVEQLRQLVSKKGCGNVNDMMDKNVYLEGVAKMLKTLDYQDLAIVVSTVISNI